MNVTVESPEFKSWFATVAERSVEYHKIHFSRINPPVFTYKDGSRYIKVIRDTGAYAFIDKPTGDIFKPATWSAPAKHSRGNLFNADNGLNCVGPYGIAYRR